MIIGVDVDNVVNNLTERVLQVYNSDNNDTLTINDITEYHMQDFVKPECRDNFYKYFVDERVWKNVSVINNCVEVVKKYHDLGHTIYFVTSTEPINVSTKANWLQKKFPFLDICERLICIQNKQLLEGIDILIDDCYENLAGGKYLKVLVEYPWNKKAKLSWDMAKCKNWKEINRVLEVFTTN